MGAKVSSESSSQNQSPKSETDDGKSFGLASSSSSRHLDEDKEKEDNDDVRHKREGCETPFIRMYVKSIAPCPGVCLSIVIVAILLLSALGFLARTDNAPDFEHAEKGFDARETEIAGRVIAINYHLQDAECDGKLTKYPTGNLTYYVWSTDAYDDDADDDANRDYCHDPNSRRRMTSTNSHQQKKSIASIAKTRGLSVPGRISHTAEKHYRSKFEPKSSTPTMKSTKIKSPMMEPVMDSHASTSRHLLASPTPSPTEYSDTLFCDEDWFFYEFVGSINIVFEATSHNTGLLTAAALKGMCTVESKVRKFHSFDGYYAYGHYCKSKSVGAYMARIAGYTDCEDLTDSDIDDVVTILEKCSNWYYNDTLDSYTNDWNTHIPSICDDYVYDLFNALLYYKYLDYEYTDVTTTLKYARLQIPTNWGDWLVDLHTELLSGMVGKSYGGAKLVAYDLDNKSDVFNAQLLIDTIWAVLAFILIFTMMALHAQSLTLAAFGFFQMIGAFGVSYFIYMIALWMPFFPFLNLTAIYIVLGIGADDFFVIVEAWKRNKAKYPFLDAQERLVKTLDEAGSAMFVTSFSTASAFLANAINPITSIKCFGLYCGLVVCIDFFLMTLFMPPLLLVYESTMQDNWCTCCTCFQRMDVTAFTDKVFTKLGAVVRKFRFAWIVMCLALVIPLSLYSTRLEFPKE